MKSTSKIRITILSNCIEYELDSQDRNMFLLVLFYESIHGYFHISNLEVKVDEHYK